MKNLIFALFLLVVISSCAVNQPQAKLQCWQSLTSNSFPFVITMANICDGPDGGTIKYTIIKPVLTFIDKRNKISDKMIDDQLRTKRAEKLY